MREIGVSLGGDKGMYPNYCRDGPVRPNDKCLHVKRRMNQKKEQRTEE